MEINLLTSTIQSGIEDFFNDPIEFTIKDGVRPASLPVKGGALADYTYLGFGVVTRRQQDRLLMYVRPDIPKHSTDPLNYHGSCGRVLAKLVQRIKSGTLHEQEIADAQVAIDILDEMSASTYLVYQQSYSNI